MSEETWVDVTPVSDESLVAESAPVVDLSPVVEPAPAPEVWRIEDGSLVPDSGAPMAPLGLEGDVLPVEGEPPVDPKDDEKVDPADVARILDVLDVPDVPEGYEVRLATVQEVEALKAELPAEDAPEVILIVTPTEGPPYEPDAAADWATYPYYTYTAYQCAHCAFDTLGADGDVASAEVAIREHYRVKHAKPAPIVRKLSLLTDVFGNPLEYQEV